MAGVKRVEGEEGARRPLAEQHGYQFAEARAGRLASPCGTSCLGVGVSVARASRVRIGKSAALVVITRYVEAIELTGVKSTERSATKNKPQAADLGLVHRAGDGNRSRTLSLGSDGASRVRPPLTCGYVFWSAFSATCSAPPFTVVVRSYGHAVGTRLVGAASRRAAGHLAMRNAWRGAPLPR